MSINLHYVEGTSEKLRHILRPHKIRYTFCTEKALRKILCKPKDRVVTEDRNNIVYETDCGNCDAVYFGGSKRSLKSLEINTKDLSKITIVKELNCETLLRSRSEL